jgi:tyrosyl-tRNA synthetase
LLIGYGLKVFNSIKKYRKVNMLAREYADKADDVYKPIIMSHHMMMGLLEG